MKIAFHNMYESLNRDLFVVHNAPIGDDLLLPFVRVKEEAARRGHLVGTLDTMDSPDAIVFIDYPDAGSFADAVLLQPLPIPKHLITFENKIVRPQNFENFARFKRVMTWNDDLVAWSPDRVVKLNYAQEFTPRPEGAHDRFMCIVASNKLHTSRASLYPERVRAIRWFEKHAPGALHLFGPGWQESAAYYLGAIPPGQKRETMASYRFALVIENAREPGYITEKLFDAMIAGCVPVYLGAPNVEAHVPRECYVDLRNFLHGDGTINYLSIFAHLMNLGTDKIDEKLAAAREWMDGDASKPFRTDTFANVVLDTVTEGRA